MLLLFNFASVFIRAKNPLYGNRNQAVDPKQLQKQVLVVSRARLIFLLCGGGNTKEKMSLARETILEENHSGIMHVAIYLG